MKLRETLVKSFLLFLILSFLTVVLDAEYVITWNHLFMLYIYAVFFSVLTFLVFQVTDKSKIIGKAIHVLFFFFTMSILFFELFYRIHVLNHPRQSIQSFYGLFNVSVSFIASMIISGFIHILSRQKYAYYGIIFFFISPAVVFFLNPSPINVLTDISNITNGPSIILVSMDTYRWDALGIYSGNEDCVLSKYIEEHNAVIYSNHYSHSPQTNPSHATMFTSLHSAENRVYTNAYALDDSFTTMAEILSENGYNTFSYISGLPMNNRISNFKQGFHIYNERYSAADKGFFPFRFFSFSKHFIKRRAVDTNRAIKSDLPLLKRGKYFLFIHYFDPHTPYKPIKMTKNPYFKDEIDKQMMIDLFNRPPMGNYMKSWIPEGAGIEYVKELYYRETEELNESMVDLFKEFEKNDLLKNSILIITADHGESLDEHNIFFDHTDSPYNTTIKVPFIIIPFYDPDYNANTHTSTLFLNNHTAHMDILPTILEVAQIENKPHNLRGISLLPFNEEPETRDHILYLFGKRNISELRVGIINDSNKIITDGSNIEIYDLEYDPHELFNLYKIAEKKENFKSLLVSADELYYDILESIGDLETMEDLSPQLRSLGYIQ